MDAVHNNKYYYENADDHLIISRLILLVTNFLPVDSERDAIQLTISDKLRLRNDPILYSRSCTRRFSFVVAI